MLGLEDGLPQGHHPVGHRRPPSFHDHRRQDSLSYCRAKDGLVHYNTLESLAVDHRGRLQTSTANEGNMVETQPEHSAHTEWLTATKLQHPRVRQDIIHRKQLLEALYGAVVSHPLTLVSAPAGYGKTTLLSALPGSYADLVIAWLSLDDDDNDPALFLGAMVAAIRRAIPACGARAHVLLTSLPNPGADVRRVIGALVNDILDTVPGEVGCQ